MNSLTSIIYDSISGGYPTLLLLCYKPIRYPHSQLIRVAFLHAKMTITDKKNHVQQSATFYTKNALKLTYGRVKPQNFSGGYTPDPQYKGQGREGREGRGKQLGREGEGRGGEGRRKGKGEEGKRRGGEVEMEMRRVPPPLFETWIRLCTHHTRSIIAAYKLQL